MNQSINQKKEYLIQNLRLVKNQKLLVSLAHKNHSNSSNLSL